MPLTDEPVHYIKFQLTQHRSLFDRPDRGSVSLTAESPYLVQQWEPPVPTPAVPKKRGKTKKGAVVQEVNPPEVVVEKSESVQPAKKAKGAPKKAKKSKVLNINPIYATWIHRQMVHKSTNEAVFSDNLLKLREVHAGNSWICKIVFQGGQTFIGESSRRNAARLRAEGVMADYTNRLNVVVYDARHPKEQ